MATSYYFIGPTTGGNTSGTSTASAFYAANGTAALPSYSFTSSTSTGMYSPASNQVAFSANGQLAMTIAKDTGAFPIIGIGTAPGSGVALGIKSQTSDAASFAINCSSQAGGTLFWVRGSGQVLGQFFQAASAGTAVTPAFIAANNTGMYSPGTNQLAFSTNSTVALTFDASQNATFQNTLSFNGTTTNNGAFGTIQAATTSSGALSGASVTLSNLIPAGSLVLGVVTRVTTAITGATSFGIGDAAAGTQYGATIAVASGTTTTIANTTLTSPKFYPSATSIVLTANGSNFTGGVVRVTVYYVSLTAPTS